MGKRKGTKTSPPTTPAIVVLLVHRNHRTPGPTRPGPARPEIACCNVDSGGMEAGLGATRCSWDGFGVPPRPLVIHEAPLGIERHNGALPGIVELSIVWQLLQRIRSFIRFPRFSTSSRDRSEIEKCHWRIVYTLFQSEKQIWRIDIVEWVREMDRFRNFNFQLIHPCSSESTL